jgi:hypothetical protein
MTRPITVTISFKTWYICLVKLIVNVGKLLIKIYGYRIEKSYLSFIKWTLNKTIEHGVIIS